MPFQHKDIPQNEHSFLNASSETLQQLRVPGIFPKMSNISSLGMKGGEYNSLKQAVHAKNTPHLAARC